MHTPSEIAARQAQIDADLMRAMDVINDPAGWLRTVSNLLSAAEALMVVIKSGRKLLRVTPRTVEEERLVSRSVQSVSTALMLYGFALECLLKAHFVQCGGKIFVDGRLKGVLRKKGTSHHDLLQLSGAVGLNAEFSEAQLDVLDKLTLYTEIGRYPMPADPSRLGQKLVPCETHGMRMKMRGIWGHPAEAICIFEMLQLLYRKLNAEMPEYANVLLENE